MAVLYLLLLVLGDNEPISPLTMKGMLLMRYPEDFGRGVFGAALPAPFLKDTFEVELDVDA